MLENLPKKKKEKSSLLYELAYSIRKKAEENLRKTSFYLFKLQILELPPSTFSFGRKFFS